MNKLARILVMVFVLGFAAAGAWAQTACVAVTAVKALTATGSYQISGTATCSDVGVSLVCCESLADNGSCDDVVTHVGTIPVKSGSWSIILDGCSCDKPYTIVAQCLDGACDPVTTSGHLPCLGTPTATATPKGSSFSYTPTPTPMGSGSGCPTLKLKVTGLTCNSTGNGVQGNYSLTFNPAVNPPGNTTISLANGNTTTVPASSFTNGSASGQLSYSCPDFGKTYVLTASGVCASTFNITTSNAVTVTVPNCAGCPLNGQITVTASTQCEYQFGIPVTSTCTGSNGNPSLYWSFGDGTFETTTVMPVSHSFAGDGTYTVSVSPSSSGNSTSTCLESVQVNVSGCGPSPTPTSTPMGSSGVNPGAPTATPTGSGTNPQPTSTATPCASCGGGSGNCGFLGLGCVGFNLCWLLALLLCLLVIGELLAIGSGLGITVPILGTVTLGLVAGVIVGLVALMIAAACPCQAVAALIIGALIGIIFLIVMLFIEPDLFPVIVPAIVAGVLIIIAALVVAAIAHCKLL